MSLNLYLSVVRVSAAVAIHVEDDVPRSSESFALVLRALPDTNVVLSTGEKLADVDIHLTLSTKWRTAQEIDRDLTASDIGFLAHINGEGGEPFIHGGGLLLNTTIISSLLSEGMTGKIRLELPTVPFEGKNGTPYVWEKNRPNMLRISYLEISAIRRESV